MTSTNDIVRKKLSVRIKIVHPYQSTFTSSRRSIVSDIGSEVICRRTCSGDYTNMYPPPPPSLLLQYGSLYFFHSKLYPMHCKTLDEIISFLYLPRLSVKNILFYYWLIKRTRAMQKSFQRRSTLIKIIHVEFNLSLHNCVHVKISEIEIKDPSTTLSNILECHMIDYHISISSLSFQIWLEYERICTRNRNYLDIFKIEHEYML